MLSLPIYNENHKHDKMKLNALHKFDSKQPTLITNEMYHHVNHKKLMNMHFQPLSNAPKELIIDKQYTKKTIPDFALNGINIGDVYYKNARKYEKGMFITY